MFQLNPDSLTFVEKPTAELLYLLAISERGSHFGSAALASDAWRR